MKRDDLFKFVEMVTLQLREEEQNYNEIRKSNVESEDLKNIVQRINSLKTLLDSLQKSIDSV